MTSQLRWKFIFIAMVVIACVLGIMRLAHFSCAGKQTTLRTESNSAWT